MMDSDDEARALNALLGRVDQHLGAYRAAHGDLDDLTNGYSGGDLAPLDDDYYNSDSMHDTNEELRGER